MQIETVTITPEIAESYLQHNIGNRPLKKGKIEKFAFSLSQGQWVQNGDTIRFDVDGKLIDGQHRLKAVIISEVALVDQPVARGLSLEAWRTIDDGTKRTDADVLARHGVPNAKGLASIAKVLMLIEGEHSPYDKVQRNLITKLDLEKWVVPKETQLTEIYKEAANANQLCKFNTTALGVMIYEITRKYGALTATDFIEGLIEGVPDGLTTHDPRSMMKAWRLRNFRPKKGTTIKTEAQLALLINGFNYWIHGKKLKKVHQPSFDATNFPVLGDKPENFSKLEDLIEGTDV